MGRLVDPISKEEYEKLSPREKWFQDHPFIVIGGIVIFLIFIGIVGEFIKRMF
jgi:hypothetical protein